MGQVRIGTTLNGGNPGETVSVTLPNGTVVNGKAGNVVNAGEALVTTDNDGNTYVHGNSSPQKTSAIVEVSRSKPIKPPLLPTGEYLFKVLQNTGLIEGFNEDIDLGALHQIDLSNYEAWGIINTGKEDYFAVLRSIEDRSTYRLFMSKNGVITTALIIFTPDQFASSVPSFHTSWNRIHAFSRLKNAVLPDGFTYPDPIEQPDHWNTIGSVYTGQLTVALWNVNTFRNGVVSNSQAQCLGTTRGINLDVFPYPYRHYLDYRQPASPLADNDPSKHLHFTPTSESATALTYDVNRSFNGTAYAWRNPFNIVVTHETNSSGTVAFGKQQPSGSNPAYTSPVISNSFNVTRNTHLFDHHDTRVQFIFASTTDTVFHEVMEEYKRDIHSTYSVDFSPGSQTERVVGNGVLDLNVDELIPLYDNVATPYIRRENYIESWNAIRQNGISYWQYDYTSYSYPRITVSPSPASLTMNRTHSVERNYTYRILALGDRCAIVRQLVNDTQMIVEENSAPPRRDPPNPFDAPNLYTYRAFSPGGHDVRYGDRNYDSDRSECVIYIGDNTYTITYENCRSFLVMDYGAGEANRINVVQEIKAYIDVLANLLPGGEPPEPSISVRVPVAYHYFNVNYAYSTLHDLITEEAGQKFSNSVGILQYESNTYQWETTLETKRRNPFWENPSYAVDAEVYIVIVHNHESFHCKGRIKRIGVEFVNGFVRESSGLEVEITEYIGEMPFLGEGNREDFDGIYVMSADDFTSAIFVFFDEIFRFTVDLSLYRVTDDDQNETVELAMARRPLGVDEQGGWYADVYRFNITSLKWERRTEGISELSALTITPLRHAISYRTP